MRRYWAPLLLVSLCACGDGGNPLPTEGELWKLFRWQKLTPVSSVVKAPDDAVICMIAPYATVVPYGLLVPDDIPSSKVINERLRSNGWTLPGENDWGFIMAIGEETYVRTYSLRGQFHPFYADHLQQMSKNGWSVKLPDGFVPTACAPLQSAVIYRTGPDDVSEYLILGTVAAPQP